MFSGGGPSFLVVVGARDFDMKWGCGVSDGNDDVVVGYILVGLLVYFMDGNVD